MIVLLKLIQPHAVVKLFGDIIPDQNLHHFVGSSFNALDSMCPRQPGCLVMGCDSCRLWCKRELGFYECTTHNFGRGVIGKTLPMAILKMLLLLYWTAMWMYRLIDIYFLLPTERRDKDPTYIRHREYSDYLTNWGDTLIFLYLIYSTLLVFHGT